ncbi:hypothetical protein C8Q73DRAFT_643342 [Cubamyces lactineus]|nr:hypothetical protein C8Q73DRAFT_643342 [Cubamyces lactineus]
MAHKAIRMEVAEFQDTFFPLPDDVTADRRPQWPAGIFNELAAGDKLTEQDIQTRFVTAINDNDLMPGLKMSTSSDKPDVTDIGNFKQKPDAAIFKADSVPTDGRPHWADQLVTVEFKRYTTSQDPFDDRKDDGFDSDAETRKEVRGQLIDYAELVFRVQHRTALFMILVINRNVRVLRWDRSGTVVTRAFDYVDQPQTLCEILWRMSLLSDEQLGMDTSATRLHPGDTDYNLMDFLALQAPDDLASEERMLKPDELKTDRPVLAHVRDKFREAVSSNWPRYRVEVPSGNTTRIFLVGKPAFYTHGMACRGTKGFVAWDTQAQRFVWLKDAWRLDYERMESEGAILRKLNAKGVINVPTLVCHGDIRNQKTRTPDIWEARQPIPSAPSGTLSASPSATLVNSSASSTSAPRKRSSGQMEVDETLGGEEEYTLRRHAHYRIVVEEIGKPLSDFRRGRQLVGVIMDCVQAHKDAVMKANVVHRDISSGNILILPTVMYDENGGNPYVSWQGLLTDWELSKPIHEAEPLLRPRQPPRTGTWQFLSVGMLTENPKTVEIPDDLESYLHVLLYFSVRYLNSDCKDPAEFIESYFDSYTLQGGVYKCGARKREVIKVAGKLTVGDGVPLFFQSPMDDIFSELLPVFKAYYKVQDHLKARTTTAEPPPEPIEPPSSPTIPSSPTSAMEERRHSRALKALPARKKWASYSDDEPTDAEKHDAALLADHDFVLSTLYNAFRSKKRWGLDKVKDRVPIDYKPQVPLAIARGASARTMKRRKTDVAAPVPPTFSSLPPRLTQSEVPKAG